MPGAGPPAVGAGFLRQVLTAGGVLPPRDEELTRAGQWLAGLLETLDIHEHRRLVRSFATWQVMCRLRQNAQARPRHRTRTASARNSISEAARFLAWLGGRGTSLRQCRQADIDEWLAAASASASESTRGFLSWAEVFSMRVTMLSSSSETSGHNRAELERRLGHANDRYLCLYTNPPDDIAASYVEDL